MTDLDIGTPPVTHLTVHGQTPGGKPITKSWAIRDINSPDATALVLEARAWDSLNQITQAIGIILRSRLDADQKIDAIHVVIHSTKVLHRAPSV